MRNNITVNKIHSQERMSAMNKYMSFAKGMAIGLAVGAATAIVIDPISDKQRHKLQRKTEGVFRSIGSVIDTAMDMIH